MTGTPEGNGPLVLTAPLLLVSLTATSLVLLLAVAALPALLLQPAPQVRPEAGTAVGAGWAVARSASGAWLLNGAPIAQEGLGRTLRSRPKGVQVLRFLPSAALTTGEVATSLAWLRQQARLPVVLEPVGAGG